MSNYRVRQVLALGPMPERQRLLLIALATWMTDDSTAVRLGTTKLLETTGLARNTFRAARSDLRKAGRLDWESRPGRGNLVSWTVLCLPGKGVNDVDPNSRTAEKGSTSPQKRGQPAPKKGVNPNALTCEKKPSGLDRRAKPQAKDGSVSNHRSVSKRPSPEDHQRQDREDLTRLRNTLGDVWDRLTPDERQARIDAAARRSR